LGICEHVANGVKHLKLDNPKLKSVAETGVTGTFDHTFSPVFDITRLTLTLDGAARTEFGETVSVYELAPKAVQFWEREIGDASAAT
jgi:hypothetical protein